MYDLHLFQMLLNTQNYAYLISSPFPPHSLYILILSNIYSLQAFEAREQQAQVDYEVDGHTTY